MDPALQQQQAAGSTGGPAPTNHEASADERLPGARPRLLAMTAGRASMPSCTGCLALAPVAVVPRPPAQATSLSTATAVAGGGCWAGRSEHTVGRGLERGRNLPSEPHQPLLQLRPLLPRQLLGSGRRRCHFAAAAIAAAVAAAPRRGSSRSLRRVRRPP